MRFLPYLIYLLLISFYRTILADIFAIGWAQIYLAALLVMLVSLNKSIFVSLWFGFAAGAIFDAPEPAYLGVHMLIFSIIGAVTAQIRERFNLESMKSRLLLVLAGLFVYSLPRVLVYEHLSSVEFFTYLLKGALPSVIYTTVIGWLFFMIQSGQISYKKLKSLF